MTECYPGNRDVCPFLPNPRLTPKIHVCGPWTRFLGCVSISCNRCMTASFYIIRHRLYLFNGGYNFNITLEAKATLIPQQTPKRIFQSFFKQVVYFSKTKRNYVLNSLNPFPLCKMQSIPLTNVSSTFHFALSTFFLCKSKSFWRCRELR